MLEQRLAKSEAARLNLEAVIEEARLCLKVVQGVDWDILNGRPLADAVEERTQAVVAAVDVLNRAGDPVMLREHDAKVLRDALGRMQQIAGVTFEQQYIDELLAEILEKGEGS